MSPAVTRRGALPLLSGLLSPALVTAAQSADVALVSAEAEVDRLSARWRAALDRMTATPAAGPTGLAAKARSVARLARQADVEGVAELAPSLAADVLRLGRARA